MMKSKRQISFRKICTFLAISTCCFMNMLHADKHTKHVRKDKKSGEPGKRGFQGNQGPQGVQGLHGTPGQPAANSFLKSYFYAFAIRQNFNPNPIPPGQPITFVTGPIAGSNIHLNGPGTGFQVTNDGFYEINFSATYTSPLPSPPAPPNTSAQCQISLLVNGNVVQQSVVTSINSLNNSGAVWTPMSVIVHIPAGGTVQLINDFSSPASIQMIDTTGIGFQTVAIITIEQLS